MIGRKEELVAAWVEGDLDAREAQRAELEVAGSPGLMVVAARMRAARERLVRHGPVVAPGTLMARVETELELPRRSARRDRRWLAATAAAGLLVLGVLTGLWLATSGTGVGPTPAAPTAGVAARLPPAWRLVTTAAPAVVQREVLAAGAAWAEAGGAVALTLDAGRAAEVERRLAALGSLEAVGEPVDALGEVQVGLRLEAPPESVGP